MVIICRYGEIFLKGLNRSSFEHTLVNNLRSELKAHNITCPTNNLRNRILIETEQPGTFIEHVFGITSFSSAQRVPLDISAITNAILSVLQSRSFTTFRISAQRLDKNFKLTSQEINKQVGNDVVKALNKKVNLTKPDIDVGIELIGGSAYIFTETIPGPCGLPVGVSGNVLVFLDSPHASLASILMLKRGCTVVGVTTSDKTFSSSITQFSSNKIPIIKISTFQEIQPLLNKYNAHAVVTGDTNPNATLTLNIPCNTLVLNPLVGMTENEAEQLLNHYESLY